MSFIAQGNTPHLQTAPSFRAPRVVRVPSETWTTLTAGVSALKLYGRVVRQHPHLLGEVLLDAAQHVRHALRV